LGSRDQHRPQRRPLLPHVTIVDAEQLGGVMLERLAELFDEDRGANTRVRNGRAA
jgi:hypothetical protein